MLFDPSRLALSGAPCDGRVVRELVSEDDLVGGLGAGRMTLSRDDFLTFIFGLRKQGRFFQNKPLSRINSLSEQ